MRLFAKTNAICMSGTYHLLYSVSHLPRLQNLHGRTRTITFNLARVAGAKKSPSVGRQSREYPPCLGLYSGIISLSVTERDLTLKNRLGRTH